MNERPQARDGAARWDSGPGRILIADDEPLLLRALSRVLRADGHRIYTANCSESVEQTLAEPGLEVVVLDLFMGTDHGLEILATIQRDRPDVQTVIMTGHGSIESAVGCMRRGAFDYLTKPFEDLSAVRRTVRGALQRARLARLRHAASADGVDADLDLASELRLVGNSAAIRRLARTIEGLRHSESHVLIQGESGTGKELVARAIHALSPRSAGPFVPVDCGALPESVIESELFGHERGSFTGAQGARGLFRMAEGGTLFLDEIGEIPAAVQAKLLRALQYKEVRPVGGGQPISVDLRVITATHRDLAAMVEVNRFRMDLYYRLNVVRVEIPPLRERPEDIPLLVQHFLHKHSQSGGSRQAECQIEDAALSAMVHHDWPGNVRELENAIESALVFARGGLLRAPDIPLARGRARTTAAPPVALPLSLEAYERSALERALRETGGNATEAARRLGIGRSTLYRKLSKHGIRDPQLTTGVGSRESIR